ncbi:Iron-sulfur assembly protein IscA-like 2, mitochondrial [Capsicum annuum]|nr:Iron-sulfur assembly protein IscA-like 2, mitochondrial [Capsicum annuum]
MLSSSSSSMIRPVVTFFTTRIRQNYRLLNSSSSSALSQFQSQSQVEALDSIVMTENCIRRIKELQTGEHKEKMLRLSVEAGGCSGFQYEFSLDDKTNSDDRIFERDGVKLVVDNISFDFVKGATVDYVEELIRSAFQVWNEDLVDSAKSYLAPHASLPKPLDCQFEQKFPSIYFHMRVVVRPALLYGAECWPVKNSHIQKMKVAEMRMLRWMCGLTRGDRVRNETIREKVGVTSVECKMREA